MTRRKFRGAKRTDLPSRRPSQRIESASETELRLETLLKKMSAWLMQQPEWVFLLAQPRASRKLVASAVADLLTRIPQRTGPLAPGQVVELETKAARLAREAEERMDALEAEEEARTDG